MPERFWARVDKSGDCWIWTASRYRRGYGQAYFEGRYYTAHRLAYTLTFGPVPMGICVCHHCDNPPCCNPAHLFLGTDADNMRDRDAKGRGRSQFKKQSHCKYGHEFTPENTYVVAKDGERACRACNRRRSAECRRRLSGIAP